MCKDEDEVFLNVFFFVDTKHNLKKLQKLNRDSWYGATASAMGLWGIGNDNLNKIVQQSQNKRKKTIR